MSDKPDDQDVFDLLARELPALDVDERRAEQKHAEGRAPGHVEQVGDDDEERLARRPAPPSQDDVVERDDREEEDQELEAAEEHVRGSAGGGRRAEELRQRLA